MDALYSTSYQNTSGTTLSNATILVNLPAGSVFKFADPAVCTAGSAAQDGAIPVSCIRGHMPAGTLFEQQIVFAAPVVTTAATPITLTSR